ncbi:AraC family transcriptional regulator [Hyphomicrobium sp.]|uniref:AraC family transcriptional regulator n=1 Tax=Hyphomicrobium sp. TaxID=82 RepID=UPI002E370D53|nr:AraC family transcriptional regulator ligand-binding domain-containing protein [Hyphomicrobium sp.]HEX2839684.1 AraC family transcriptional regulator ligand-binding domain-containing protein [Hyphomicrobium sp.]
MAPRLSGFTRASSLGPITDFMDRQGGSAARVLRGVDLPFAVLEQPEIVIPLRAQFRFLESAAREIGDPHFGARLGQVVRMANLSAFGAWVCAAETLTQAMERGHAGLNTMLQTSTVLTLLRNGPKVRWFIEFVEPETDGRHHNELLGVAYQIDVVRTYAGRQWRPDVVLTALPRGSPRAELEEIFGTNISHGHPVPGIEFDAALLGRGLFRSADVPVRRSQAEPLVPGNGDTIGTIAAVADLALCEGYPRVDWVAAKLGTTRRSLQRHLREHGTSFNRIVEDALCKRAKDLLTQGTVPVTEIAFQLGYSDPAHFSRAFRRWTGVAPTAYRAA